MSTYTIFMEDPTSYNRRLVNGSATYEWRMKKQPTCKSMKNDKQKNLRKAPNETFNGGVGKILEMIYENV